MLWSAIFALLAAALLVVYLQRRADVHQQQQTAKILQQVREQAADAVISRLQQVLNAAVIDTIESVGHPQGEFILSRVATAFQAGVAKHPEIERFFVWSDQNPPQFRNEVLFYQPSADPAARGIPVNSPEGRPLGAFISDAAMGPDIFHLAVPSTSTRRGFVVLEYSLRGVPYQVVAHFLWVDPRRTKFYGILGYCVNLAETEKRLFPNLLRTGLEDMLNPDPANPPQHLTVRNERGRIVYGREVPPGATQATRSIDMLFFPTQVPRQWLAARPPDRRWLVTVSGGPLLPVFTADWVSAAIVLLILVAIVYAVTVQSQAVRLAQMQSTFVTNVTHELKTPLSLLLGASETLGLGRVNSPAKIDQYIGIVRSQADRLSKLVDRILRFSASEAGSNRMRETVDVGAVVQECVDDFKAASGPELTIRYDKAPQPLHVHQANRAGLKEVVMNLLENAVNYSNGTKHIHVRAQAKGRTALISVRDHGLGIDPVDLPHIFEKFYRGRVGLTQRRPGFGLGLAIVKSVVRAHGGDVQVQSEPGSGSEFSVVLPIGRKSKGHVIPRAHR